MGRTVSIGAQGFARLREQDDFYVDKTGFIAEWWNSHDIVTLVCRPRRFGKTLNMSMTECFFSDAYAGRPDLFEGLEVWSDATLRPEQGAWPVVPLSFASIKATSFERASLGLCEVLRSTFAAHAELMNDTRLTNDERAFVSRLAAHVTEDEAPSCLNRLCALLGKSREKHPIVLLDEYDTPMQEAWTHGYWKEMAGFMRELFNATFKTNPHLERGLLTGVTRVSKESIFSDLNNLEVVTVTSDKYATCFGFTEGEVFAAMEEMGREDRAGVKEWYDGFTFGNATDIYNPWSITQYLDKGRFIAYWANSGGNLLVSDLVRGGDPDLKSDFETLLQGGSLHKTFNEELALSQLGDNPDAIWPLLLAGGYVRADNAMPLGKHTTCDLALVNREAREDLADLVRSWFNRAKGSYNRFVQALLSSDLQEMNRYLNDVALKTVSMFDSGTHPSGETEPERFYHGLVLGLLVELDGRYHVRSNRESGYGRYDVMLYPLDPARDDGIVMEFKVLDREGGERSLEEAVAAARAQIEGRAYKAELHACGLPLERIHAYGFAFEGKHVLIG